MRRSVFAAAFILAAVGLSLRQKSGKPNNKDDKARDKKACFTRQAKEDAERNARVFHDPGGVSSRLLKREVRYEK